MGEVPEPTHRRRLPSTEPGVVVLVSYRPNPALFRAQLESIRDQTLSDFVCVIAADGDETSTRELVADIVGGDSRFRVLGYSDNLGLYRNVERALGAVPPDVGWVALADQDDAWQPQRLERLLPLLDDGFALAMNQARVVQWPSGRILSERTSRRVVPPQALVFENQVTGSFSVFRRDLLDVALPFPSIRTFTQFHDHWIGLCAATTAGYGVLDVALQDYVQHGANIVGEALERPARNPLVSLRRIKALADEYEGGHSLAKCLRTYAMGSFGWRRAMTETIAARVPLSPELSALDQHLSLSAGPLAAIQLLREASGSSDVTPGALEAFVAGLPYELVDRLRRRGRQVSQPPTVQADEH